MGPAQTIELFDRFEKCKVLVVGDVMLDTYIYGEVRRISPEAPIPVVNVRSKQSCLGGAANVALNVKALGATVDLFSVVGEDMPGAELMECLEENDLWTGGIIRSADRRTTVKSRVISGSQHVVRLDEEDLHDLNGAETKRLIEAIQSKVAEYDMVILEDYDKGCLTSNVIKEIIRLSKQHGVATAVDPKKAHFLDYVGVTLFKPNLHELVDGLQMPVDLGNIDEAAHLLQKKLENDNLLVTLSQYGVYYSGEHDHGRLPAHIRDISNVSGAGDTVIAVAALCLASGSNLRETATLANLAGGIVCESPGIVPIDKERLLQEALQLQDVKN